MTSLAERIQQIDGSDDDENADHRKEIFDRFVELGLLEEINSQHVAFCLPSLDVTAKHTLMIRQQMNRGSRKLTLANLLLDHLQQNWTLS